MKNMFGLDFAVDGVLDQFCDWIYGKLITFFGKFFSMINMMGRNFLSWIGSKQSCSFFIISPGRCISLVL